MRRRWSSLGCLVLALLALPGAAADRRPPMLRADTRDHASRGAPDRRPPTATPRPRAKSQEPRAKGQERERSEPSAPRVGPDLPVCFEHDVEPVLSRAGCNQGGCHGKATGQNGFRLSLFGFDPQFDYDAIVKEGRGRRVTPERPEESLILMKASAAIPHGGGRRLEAGSPGYRLLQHWIAQGMAFTEKGRPSVVRLSVAPAARLMQPRQTQRLVVTAHYSDGSTRNVTAEALFRSNEEGLATVDEHGVVTTGKQPGEAAIMASYMGQVAVFRAAVPLGAPASYLLNSPQAPNPTPTRLFVAIPGACPTLPLPSRAPLVI